MSEWRERERLVRARGHRVHSVTALAWDEGGRVVPLRPQPGEDVQGVRTVGRHPALFLYDPRPLWRLLGREWDVLDLHEEPFALATAQVLLIRALRRSRTPYILYSAQNLDKRYPVPFRWLERWALRHASAASVCNTQAGRIVTRKGLTGRAVTIPLGFDPASFTPTDDRPRPRGRSLRVGYAGRLDRHKGVHVLLEAVAREPALDLVVAGAGPAEGDLRRRALDPRLQGRVDFLGALEADELRSFYRGIDVLAVPSLTTAGWVEQFGRVAVEAMACGTPVVASDSGALPEVVGDAGLLVPPGDAAALAEALRTLDAQPGLSARMRSEGIKRARSCGWDVIGEKYVELYESVARGDVPVAEGDVPEHRDVEIIVVAFHGADLLRACLSPVAHLPVTVVDNSCDPDVRRVCESQGVRYLDAGRNGGFAAGVNHGLARRALPDADVLLLNPDAVIDAESVATLQSALHTEPDLASVGPAQVDDRGVPGRVSWPFPSPWGAWLEAVGLGRLQRDAYVIGSVLLLRAQALRQVGGLDESYFLYAEETDWARRASNLGWRHREVPQVRATHVGAASSSDPGRREAHFHASQERYLRTHFGSLGWQVARAGVVAGAAARAIVLSGHRRAAARDRAVRYLRGPVRVEATQTGRVPSPDRSGGTP